MTTAPQTSTWRKIFSRSMLICIFTGFTSGLPLYFLINLIPAWLRSEHVDLKTIGLMALIGLPFTWKFIWSPVIDLVRLPFFRTAARLDAGYANWFTADLAHLRLPKSCSAFICNYGLIVGGCLFSLPAKILYWMHFAAKFCQMKN